MTTLAVKLSSRGVRSLNSTNFRAPWPFVKKGETGQRKIGPFVHEKLKWPGPNREFPELSPKWHKENPKELHRITMSEKTALVVITEGSEEMEAVIVTDVLRRGAVKVTVAGLASKDPVKCARGTLIVPDAALSELQSEIYDVIVLPGGQPGSDTFAASEAVGVALKNHFENGRIVSAICAAPIALKAHGIPADSLTSHPSVKKQLEEGGYSYSEDRVVVAGRIVTSRGPGTACEFALKLVELLQGQEKAQSLVGPMLLQL